MARIQEATKRQFSKSQGFVKVYLIKAVVSSEKFWKDIFSHGGEYFSKVWKSFAKIYLPKVCKDLPCQGGGQFSAHLSYLGHTVPAINWTGSSQPAEVRSRTGDSQCRQFIENQQVMRVDHYCHLMIISKWRKSLPAHPTPVRDWSPGCCQSPRHRQQQFHTGAKENMSIALLMSTSM